MQMEPTEAYEVLCYVPARSLPYNQPGTCYTLVALPKEDPTAGKPPSRAHPGLPGGLGAQTGWAGCAPAVRLPREPQPLDFNLEERKGRARGTCHTSSQFTLMEGPWG